MKTLLGKLFLLHMPINAGLLEQDLKVDKIEPSFWWAGMKWNHVQLMVFGIGMNNVQAKFNREYFKIEKVYQLENKTYSFIDVLISGKLARSHTS